MDIRKYFAKKADDEPATKKPKRANAPGGGATITTTVVVTPAATLARNGTAIHVTNDKKLSKQNPPGRPSKAHMAQRRKWVKESKCFVCQEKCDDEDELEPCQCFQKHGIKGFGMIFCQECEDDGVYHCSGPCRERLCFRSCEYSRCAECGQEYCQACLDTTDDMLSCGNCDTMYCEDCMKSSEREGKAMLKRCDFCDADSCVECDKTVRACDFCSKTLCDKCVDKRSEAFDGRFCVSCAQDGADDCQHEHEMICRYGADYEDYM